MADSPEVSKRVPVRPLHKSVRDLVEPEYRILHDDQYQYENDDINTDEVSRAGPSKFAGTSSPPSTVASSRDVKWPEFRFGFTSLVEIHPGPVVS
jgi:hypothetical protein